MKTVYFTTDRFVRREGNVIDLNEYRERMQRAAEEPCAVNGSMPRWVHDAPEWLSEVTPLRAESDRRAEAKRRRPSFQFGDLLEMAASAGALVLVATVWLQFLM